LKCSQLWQILPIYIDQRSFGVHVVPVQRRGIVDEQPLCLCNNNKPVDRFFCRRNKLIVIERVFPGEPDEEWVRSLAWLASSWRGEGRWGVCVGEVTLKEGFSEVRDDNFILGG